jgi:hypothetical protein
MSDLVELAEVPELFERWLAGRPLAERSRREYARNVRAYCAWLAETRVAGGDARGWRRRRTVMAGRATRGSIRWHVIMPLGISAATCRSRSARRLRR